jgi:gliding motility-associated-like protein
MRNPLLIFLFFCNTAFAQVNLNLGLKAYYPFNGNANDISGNNNNPFFNNATLTADRFGNPNTAYHFNGTNTYMKVQNNPTINMSNQMSIALWVKPMGWYTGICYNNMMVMKGFNDNNPAGNYYIRFSDVYTGCTTPTTTQERFNGTGVVSPLPIIQLNQWYSVVWTYDGTTARLYVNCELKQSTNISLTFTNANDLFMGCMEDPVFPYWLNGDLDEIRIYDRPLNAAEVSAYGNCSSGAGTNISNVINDYTPVLALNPCENKFTVENASAYNIGDTVLLIQMKGAIIDSTNTAAFGTVTDYKNSGNYEFNYVKSKSGNIIELKNTLTRQYDIPAGKVQLIRVPYYQNVNITSTLTCLPWDGSKGGVLVLNVQDTVNLSADINVSGRGFKGGQPLFLTNVHCNKVDYFYPSANNDGGQKGEGIATISTAKLYGRGALANGGGGNSHNAGGAGGGNAGAGGTGGNQYPLALCPIIIPVTGGISGNSLPYSNASDKVFLGGGGGAGHANDLTDKPGGNGGGMIIMSARVIVGNANSIKSNGENVIECAAQIITCANDGHSGGGSGGSILLSTNQYLNNITIEAKGGKGADAWIMPGSVFTTGPGGGGGGGIVWLNQPATPAIVSTALQGGLNGVAKQLANDPWGATPGIAGTNLFNLSIPISTIPFKPNIDSVRLKDSAISCDSYNFKGLGYTNTNPVANWSWDFGDGNTANTQNTNHSYTGTGTFTVKLIITDINGCKDSISKDVNSSLLTMDAGLNDTICNASSTVLQATNTGGTIFSWSPAAYVNDPALLNPTATPPSTTKFYLTATNAQGCSKTDSVIINVRSANTFTVNPPVSVCKNDSIQLSASGGDLYVWQPAATLNNAAIANPFAAPQVNTPYTVQITDTICNNTTTLSTTVSVIALPVIIATKSNDIDCSSNQSQLTATGAVQYNWSPAATLNSPNSGSPVATPLATTKYVVSGTALSGCTNYDSVTVNVNINGSSNYLMPTAFTPNNDGKNDCYGIKFWGIVQEIDFSIYNRWGERVFHSTKVGDCWNGTYKGVSQNTAVFVYVIRAKTTCQPTVFRKGTFALIR